MTVLLVTGGAGTLGSAIVHELGQGYDRVIVLDNFVTGKRTSLPNAANLEVVEGSVDDPHLVGSIIHEYQPVHVVHAAAAYKDPRDWDSDINTNVLGSSVLARALETAPLTKLVYLQTALCYGRPDVVPIPVDAPNRPFTSYGISKTAGEQYLLNSGLPVTSLRLANVTGPRLAIGPIPTFYQRLKAGKACFASDAVRDFIDVSDFIALMRLVLEDGSSHGTFNVSTGEATAIKDVYRIVASHLGLSDTGVEVRPIGSDDVQAVVLDPSRTEEAFGWTCNLTAEQSIIRLLGWYDQFGVTDIYSHLHAITEPRNE